MSMNETIVPLLLRRKFNSKNTAGD